MITHIVFWNLHQQAVIGFVRSVASERSVVDYES